MRENIKKFLNKTVKVHIDRKMGSRHPKWNYIYPLNYGYVPNTLNTDGEEIDCYVLGVFEPIDRFKGKCIALIHRLDDDDDKLIVVPDGKNYSNDAIIALTEFQERYFSIEIVR